jgi:hypothetical protein
MQTHPATPQPVAAAPNYGGTPAPSYGAPPEAAPPPPQPPMPQPESRPWA